MTRSARLDVLVVCAAVVLALGLGVACSQRVALHLGDLVDLGKRFLELAAVVAAGLAYRSQDSTTAAHVREPAVVAADVAVVTPERR